jgi:hypothetical protein
MEDRRFAWALLALVGVLGAGAALGLTLRPAGAPPDVSPGSPRDPEFVVECTWSHRAADDPIVHAGHPGVAHSHDFFGNVATDASSTGPSLLGGESSCQTHADTAAYWSPTLYDGDEAVEPGRLFAYYRRGTGVDPNAIGAYPLGLAIIAGDPEADGPQPTGIVGWQCGSSGVVTLPGACPPSAPLTLRVVFPSCWDGIRLDSEDHRSHMAYPSASGCPAGHPVAMPELVVDVAYVFSGDPSQLRLASGSVLGGHADFLNGWDPAALEELVRACLGRGVECGVPASRTSG